MAIIAPHTAPNFAFGNYHRIQDIRYVCNAAEPEPHWLVVVAFYANAEARNLNTEPMYTHSVKLPRGVDLGNGVIVGDPRAGIYDLLMHTLFAGTNAEPHLDVELPPPDPA